MLLEKNLSFLKSITFKKKLSTGTMLIPIRLNNCSVLLVKRASSCVMNFISRITTYYNSSLAKYHFSCAIQDHLLNRIGITLGADYLVGADYQIIKSIRHYILKLFNNELRKRGF